MSWDITVGDFPDVPTVQDIPDDYRLRPIGSRAEVIALIVEEVPAADFSDPSWGLIEGGSWSIEVNIGNDLECKDMMLHVRGGGDEVLDVIQRILDKLGVRGIDCSSGDFFSREASAETFRQWQAYRDQIGSNPLPPEPPPKPSLFRRLFGG